MINSRFQPQPPVHGRPWGQEPPVYKESNGLFVGPQQVGLDLLANGRFDAGRDAVLAFDFDHNGTVTPAEVKQSYQQYQANGWLHLDANGDGRLNSNELNQGGAQVLIDRNHDGFFGSREVFDPLNIPKPGRPWR